MYKKVLEVDLGWLESLARVKRKKFLPVVLSVSEVREILQNMHGTTKLMAELIYGTGMRVNECVQLRIKDIDFDLKTITVRHGKGGKDRSTLLPAMLVAPLRSHLLKVMENHKEDCLRGAGYVPLPGALYKKYPKAGQSIGWQYVFHRQPHVSGRRQDKRSVGTVQHQHHNEHFERPCQKQTS